MKTIYAKKSLGEFGMVVYNLRNLGFTSMTEDVYASAIFLLLKAKVNDLAGDEYRNSVLESIKEWIQVVLLQFLHKLFDNLGDSISYFSPSIAKSPLASCASSGDKPSERIIRWQLRLDVPAIDDLKQCLEYTGQHSKLVDTFISSLREYLRGRKDTIKCIVTMLTDGMTGNNEGPGNAGDSLLEELNRDEENQENNGLDDDINTNDKQAWINIQQWEPNPIEADPLKGSRY
ncbi:hypothetical protein Tco_0386713 [Tanacetum coccineum]